LELEIHKYTNTQTVLNSCVAGENSELSHQSTHTRRFSGTQKIVVSCRDTNLRLTTAIPTITNTLRKHRAVVAGRSPPTHLRHNTSRAGLLTARLNGKVACYYSSGSSNVWLLASCCCGVIRLRCGRLGLADRHIMTRLQRSLRYADK